MSEKEIQQGKEKGAIGKPFNLAVIETKQKLINVVNESKLPISVTAMVVNELLQAINIQAQQEISKEKQQYEQALKKQGDKR